MEKNSNTFSVSGSNHQCYINTLQHIIGQNSCYIPEIVNANFSLSPIIIKAPSVLNISQIKYHRTVLNKLAKSFPTVFSSSNTETSYPSVLYNRLKLKLAETPYSTSANKKIIIPTYTFVPLVLHLQIMQYLILQQGLSVQSATHFSNIDDLYAFIETNYNAQILKKDMPTAVSIWLNEQIQEGYSSGELIDFVDRLYDQYKYTKISPPSFQIIFRCFGHHTIGIANAAFDYFSETRDYYSSWEKSISKFLTQTFYFTNAASNQMAFMLLQFKY